MAFRDRVDQDALAAEWGVALEAEQNAAAESGVAPPVEAESGAEAMAAHWAAMVDDGHFIQAAKGGAERILTQEEIDSLLGFSLADVSLNDNSGIRALPRLEIVFDRLVRLLTTSLRNFTSDNVEVSLDRITSVRFGDYLNSIPLPAILGLFKAEEWENSGLITVNSNLIYSIIDVLLGGRRGQLAIRIEGRPYTTIETNLIKRMIEVVLADAELALNDLDRRIAAGKSVIGRLAQAITNEGPRADGPIR
jgi:flagellar motor switch protein FliM